MIKINLKVLKQYSLLFLALLYSGHAIAASSNAWYGVSKYYVGIVLFVIWLIRRHGKVLVGHNNGASFGILVAWAIIMFLNCIFHSATETFYGYFAIFTTPLIAFVIVTSIDQNIFGRMYVRVMFIISIISLAFFYFFQFTPIFELFPTLLGLDQFGDVNEKYKGLFFYYRLDPSRNNGPFWEPGIYASFLIFAFLFAHKFVEERRKRLVYYLVFTLTILSTGSSAGYVLLILAMICIVSYKISQNKDSTQRCIYSIVCIILTVVACIAYLNLETLIDTLGLSGNMTVTKLLDVTENARVTSMSWSWQKFLERPLFGHGIVGLSLQGGGAETSTTTSLRLMAALGIAGVLFTVIMVIGVFRQKRISFLTKSIFLLIWLMIVNKESQDAFVLHWVLVFYFNSTDDMLCRKST